MIFITLGSQRFQFNRLLKAVDKLVENATITDKVFAQIGYSDYNPQNYQFTRFLDRDEFAKIIEEADIVITQGGTGSIMEEVKKEKKVIAIPRRMKYGEHIDDHQLQVVRQFKDLNLICECDDAEKISDALNLVKKSTYKKYVSNTPKIIDSIINFLER